MASYHGPVLPRQQAVTDAVQRLGAYVANPQDFYSLVVFYVSFVFDDCYNAFMSSRNVVNTHMLS